MQAKTRRLERWENDVNELDNLLQDQLKRSVETIRLSAYAEQLVTALRNRDDLPGLTKERTEEEWRRRSDERQAAQAVVAEHLDRVGLLAARVRQIQPRNRRWFELRHRTTALRFHLQNYLWAVAGLVESEDETEHNAWWDAQDAARKALIDVIRPLVEAQRPPRQHPLDRWPVLSRLLDPWPDSDAGVPGGLL